VLQPGQEIGKYVVEALVGEGGLARVYRVRHATLGSAYALKLLAVRGGAVHRRLVREGRIQATLDHPHVVSVIDVIEHEGHPGLVMEYIEGLSLDRLLGARGALPIDATLALTAQILGAMDAAHSRGVLHRDLKPANVMLQPVSGGARAAVTDFGIARLMAANEGDTLQGDFLGTPGFMAPEQVSDPTAVDPRADIYSLGALIYCMVCGRPPFLPSASLVDTLHAAEQARFPKVLELRPDCPPDVAATIEAALAPKPEDRPESVAALGALLFADAPELMQVVGGHRGIVPLSLPKVSHAQGAASLQPITPARPPTTPSGGAFTAVPETFDGRPADAMGGAATAVPDLSDPPPEAPQPTASPKWPWAVGVLAVVVGLAVMFRPATPEPAPPAAPTATAPAPQPPKAPPAKPADETPSAATPVPAAEPVEAPPSPAPPPAATRTAPSDTPVPPPEAPATTAPEPEEPPAEEPPAEAPADEPPAEEPPAEVPEPEDEPAVADADVAPEAPSEAPLPPEAPPMPDVTGTWKGKYGGRPLTLRIDGQTGDRVSASFDVLAGPSTWKTISLTGRVRADGGIALSDPGTGWSLDGMTAGNALTGSIRHPDLRKPMALKATRR